MPRTCGAGSCSCTAGKTERTAKMTSRASACTQNAERERRTSWVILVSKASRNDPFVQAREHRYQQQTTKEALAATALRCKQADPLPNEQRRRTNASRTSSGAQQR